MVYLSLTSHHCPWPLLNNHHPRRHCLRSALSSRARPWPQQDQQDNDSNIPDITAKDALLQRFYIRQLTPPFTQCPSAGISSSSCIHLRTQARTLLRTTCRLPRSHPRPPSSLALAGALARPVQPSDRCDKQRVNRPPSEQLPHQSLCSSTSHRKMSTPALSPTPTVVSSSSPQSITFPRQRHCCPSSEKFTASSRASTATSPVQAFVASPGIVTVDDLASALALSSLADVVLGHDERHASESAGSSSGQSPTAAAATENIPKSHRPPSLLGPPSPPDSETDKNCGADDIAALPPLIKPRRRLNRMNHRRLSLNHLPRQRSLPPPPPPPPTAIDVTETPPLTPQPQPAGEKDAYIGDSAAIEVRISKKPQGKARARRAALPRLPALAYAMPGRNGKTWQDSVVSGHRVANVTLTSPVLHRTPGSVHGRTSARFELLHRSEYERTDLPPLRNAADYVKHTCRGVNEDHSGCTNPVYSPRMSRYCALGCKFDRFRAETLRAVSDRSRADVHRSSRDWPNRPPLRGCVEGPRTQPCTQRAT